jgi:hypothetical protein
LNTVDGLAEQAGVCVCRGEKGRVVEFWELELASKSFQLNPGRLCSIWKLTVF